ncbi:MULTISPECIES: cryptochrome/photolyase family protein [Subtercola]|uniref:Deoxyribodipyrimidine photo-lyase n=1 Tax=Subtercola vilae TaxID=2056433 RepID=A0A4T2C640_9MICO|nr:MULTISPECIES: deoxyribodipyrimidine photo-lyase [Subtercola]MEA9984724.1 deoxyribodipyrimidine photo-lyase [Subtercola sp. RTI3]TIH39032.1 deoxyribodipyrimidine photo-lyase [Subtercola vilae]
MGSASVVWFRDDLRVADHPALDAAVRRGEPIVAVYVFDEVSAGVRPLGAASKWWLHHSLLALAGELDARGLTLTFRRGPATEVIAELLAETGAGAVFWNRRYALAEREIDSGIKSSLKEQGVEARSFQANVLFEPWTLQTGQGAPYRVFTPFWRACLGAKPPREPLSAPERGDVTPFGGPLASEDIASWQLLPTKPDWAGGLREAWVPGEKAAHDQIDAFEHSGLGDYVDDRDKPAVDATSRMSPRLRFGEISPFQLWHTMRGGVSGAGGAAAYLREVGWREFAYHLLYHFPSITTENMRPAFNAFPWAKPEPEVLHAWQQGLTGIPLVDAGMRELWQTGVMHNRIRMVAASFLVKNLLIDWRVGEAWFWDTLVDADLASNTMNWQWVAGSGVDAAPYFRVFNPELQAKKFDPAGEYINHFVPEAGTPAYPEPMVDLGESRKRALAAYEQVRGS